MTHPFDGTWCFYNLDFTPKLILATPDAGNSNLQNFVSASVQYLPSCTGSPVAQVTVYNPAIPGHNPRVYALFE